MKPFLLSGLLLALLSCTEKEHDKDAPESLLGFIPKHYMLTDTARGDLNRDGLTDLVMLLSPEADSLSDPDQPEERPLVLLLGQKDRTYKEVLRHPKAVYCVACGGMLGDPYQKISVRDGDLVVEHFGGSSWKWARTTTFRYAPSKDDWYLAEDAVVSYHGGDPDHLETRILTPRDFGEVRFSEFDIYQSEQ